MNPLQFDGFPSQQQNEPEESLSEGFLKNVEEADRAVVEKYIKDWDAGVTKRFQSIHQEYEPYKQLGMDPDTLRNAAWFYSQLDTDPLGMYKLMHKALKESNMWEDPEDREIEGGRQDSLPEYEGIPKEFLNEFKSMKDELNQLRETTHGFAQSQQEREEMSMLDDVLSQMHDVAGDFDDEWVLTRLARGMSPQDALEEYAQFVDRIGNSRQRKPAPNVFGGGGVPAGQVDGSRPKTGQDRRAFIAQALEASQQG